MRAVLDTNILISALMVRGTPPDPNDDFLLAAAQASGAQFLVTGDKSDLLALRTHGVTRIVTARLFADMLDH